MVTVGEGVRMGRNYVIPWGRVEGTKNVRGRRGRFFTLPSDLVPHGLHPRVSTIRVLRVSRVVLCEGR